MFSNKWLIGAAAVAGMAFAQTASAAKLSLCVFDPMGTKGDAYAFAQEYVLKMKSLGYDVEPKAYNNEAVLAEDFRVGSCDGAAMTNLRARAFNKFSGSLDAIGAVTDYKTLQSALNILSSTKAAKYMKSGKYEVVGLVPLGAAYVMVNDRSINSLDKAAGKKIAAMDFDKTQARMIETIGGQPVSVDLTSIGGKFNNGQVDIIAGPAVIFKPLELYRGMTAADGSVKGAIFRYPLLQLNASVVVNTSAGKFDKPAANQKIREYINSNLGKIYKFVDKEEAGIDDKYWLDVKASDKPGYEKLMREARIQMTQEGYYDSTMMKLLKKVRCKHDPSRYECALEDE